MDNKAVVDLNWLCNWLEENSSGVYRPSKEAAHVIRSMSAEIESLRAQLKDVQKTADESVRLLHIREKQWIESKNEARELSAQLKASDGSPSELEMHRADHNSVKEAEFESVGELLAAYKVLDEKIKAAQTENSELRTQRIFDNSDLKRINDLGYPDLISLISATKAAQEQEPYAYAITGDSIDMVAKIADVQMVKSEQPRWHISPLYAAPIPAQPSPAVAVPEVTPNMLRAAQLKSELGAYACSNLSGGYELIRELFEVMISESGTSPRITEQDARDIALKYYQWRTFNTYPKSHADFWDSWIRLEGRALLNKLNNKTKSSFDECSATGQSCAYDNIDIRGKAVSQCAYCGKPEREELRASDLG